MTVLVQNQGKRRFIVAEGTLMPLGTLEMEDEAAKKVCGSYPEELKILKVLSKQPAEQAENLEEDLMLKTKVELMEMLDEKGIDYKPIMNKAQLIELLQGE
jgi:hypothetical protein